VGRTSALTNGSTVCEHPVEAFEKENESTQKVCLLSCYFSLPGTTYIKSCFHRYALERPDIIGLDARSAVFQCMHGHSWHVDVEPPPPTSQHESTTTTARGTTRDEQGKKEEEATRAWGTPLLHEVGHRRPANSGQSPEETTASSFKVARRPAVLHFNSYDGKEMMAQVVEALRNAA